MAITVVTVMLILMILMILAMMVVYAASYKKVPPNKAMVLFRGSRKKGAGPHAVIQGGGKFIIPGVERHSVLDMGANLVEFTVTGVPTASEGRPVTLRLNVAAIWRIVSDDQVLRRSAGNLVDRTKGENEMSVKELLEKAIRNISAGMAPEVFEIDMDIVGTKVGVAANDALIDLGLVVLAVHFLMVRPQG